MTKKQKSLQFTHNPLASVYLFRMSDETFRFAFIAFLSGILKALRDTVAHHWDKSIFKLIEYEPLFQWFESDWQRKYEFPFWRLYAPFIDAWHFGDFFSYVLIGLGYTFAAKKMYIEWYHHLIFLLSWLLGFNLFYTYLFVI